MYLIESSGDFWVNICKTIGTEPGISEAYRNTGYFMNLDDCGRDWWCSPNTHTLFSSPASLALRLGCITELGRVEHEQH